jgi:hypothetical protein
MLVKYPASTQRVFRPEGCGKAAGITPSSLVKL